jgi:hypothetical protein
MLNWCSSRSQVSKFRSAKISGQGSVIDSTSALSKSSGLGGGDVRVGGGNVIVIVLRWIAHIQGRNCLRQVVPCPRIVYKVPRLSTDSYH